jgi:hypothetical protein
MATFDLALGHSAEDAGHGKRHAEVKHCSHCPTLHVHSHRCYLEGVGRRTSWLMV